MNRLTHQEIMDLLDQDSSEGREKVFNYILSIGLINGSDDLEQDLISLIDHINMKNSKIGKDLLNSDLFKPFINNKVKINPKVSNDWCINYRTVDVNNGYMTLSSKDQYIHRIPSFKFFDLLNNGTIDENGNQMPVSIIGNRLQGNFIINNQREIYSDHFYNIWKRIHGLDKLAANQDRQPKGIKKEELIQGRTYKVNHNNNSISLERFLGYKYIIKYQIFNGELIPKISRQRMAISTWISKFNLKSNMSEDFHGVIKTLSPLKKLSYHEEFDTLPFMQKLSPELELKKIKNTYTHTPYFLDVIEELPAPKSKLGFKLKPVVHDGLVHVVKVNNVYLFSSTPIGIGSSGSIVFRPNGVLVPMINTFGKFKFYPLNSPEQYSKFNVPTGPMATNIQTSEAYSLEITPLIEKGLRLNIIDDIMN